MRQKNSKPSKQEKQAAKAIQSTMAKKPAKAVKASQVVTFADKFYKPEDLVGINFWVRRCQKDITEINDREIEVIVYDVVLESGKTGTLTLAYNDTRWEQAEQINRADGYVGAFTVEKVPWKSSATGYFWSLALGSESAMLAQEYLNRDADIPF
jgi:hypothetical protein